MTSRPSRRLFGPSTVRLSLRFLGSSPRLPPPRLQCSRSSVLAAPQTRSELRPSSNAPTLALVTSPASSSPCSSLTPTGPTTSRRQTRDGRRGPPTRISIRPATLESTGTRVRVSTGRECAVGEHHCVPLSVPNEYLDRRAYPLGWSSPGFSPAAPWPAAVEQPAWSVPLLSESGSPPVALVRRSVCNVTRVNASRQILDFGQVRGASSSLGTKCIVRAHHSFSFQYAGGELRLREFSCAPSPS